jgi:hypothetical protein
MELIHDISMEAEAVPASFARIVRRNQEPAFEPLNLKQLFPEQFGRCWW